MIAPAPPPPAAPRPQPQAASRGVRPLSRPEVPAARLVAPAHGGPAARVGAWPLARALALLIAAASALAVAVASGLAALSLAPSPAIWAAAAGAVVGTLALGGPAALVLLRAARDSARPQSAAVLDPSTGAASRDVLLDVAAREFARARRYGGGAALLLVEVDRFHRLGETAAGRNGDAGEAVLRELARHVAPTLRGADVLARWHGAQLAVFLVHADPTGALDVAERIRELAEALEVPWAPQRLRFTTSVGVVHMDSSHGSVQAMLDDADDALVAARQAGGNSVRAAPLDHPIPPVPGGVPGLRGDGQRTRPAP